MTPEDLRTRLRHPNGSVRLQAAMSIGTTKDPRTIDLLVERCGIDPDFFVRDMLTWSLTRLPADLTVPRLVEELSSPFPQSRSQALHTLSKIADPRARPAVTGALLHDEEDEVAKAAWRAAVILVAPGGEAPLAEDLARELGQRDADTRRSLTRAFVSLGEASRPVLDRVAGFSAFTARVHARTTLLLLDDPECDYRSAAEEAREAVLRADRPLG